MEFFVQLSNPRTNDIKLKGESVSEAIEDLFPLNTEYFILSWKYYRIALSYKYDISEIIIDLIKMCEKILAQEEGSINCTFPSNSFHADWVLNWNEEDVIINAKWYSVIGNIEELLNDSGSLKTSKEDFLSEWNSLFSMLASKLEANNFFSDEMWRIKSLINEIKKKGTLYR